MTTKKYTLYNDMKFRLMKCVDCSQKMKIFWYEKYNSNVLVCPKCIRTKQISSYEYFHMEMP